MDWSYWFRILAGCAVPFAFLATGLGIGYMAVELARRRREVDEAIRKLREEHRRSE